MTMMNWDCWEYGIRWHWCMNSEWLIKFSLVMYRAISPRLSVKTTIGKTVFISAVSQDSTLQASWFRIPSRTYLNSPWIFKYRLILYATEDGWLAGAYSATRQNCVITIINIKKSSIRYLTMSSIDHRSPRSPMKALRPLENIPRPVQKSKQLGIDIFTKKRELENDDHATNPPAKKAKVELNDSITVAGSTVKDGVICHHCRRHVGLELTVQCTHLRTKEKRCGAVYCQRCLCNRYNDLMAEIKSVRENREDHVDNAGYTWSCYRCRGICRCSKCKQTMAERAYFSSTMY